MNLLITVAFLVFVAWVIPRSVLPMLNNSLSSSKGLAGDPLIGVLAGGGDDAIHVRVGVWTLCGLDPNTRNWVEAVHGAQAECWTCQQKLQEQKEAQRGI